MPTLVDRFFMWAERQSDGAVLGGILTVIVGFWSAFAAGAWWLFS